MGIDAFLATLKWNPNIVPQDASASEAVLMSAYFKGNIIAARGGKVHKGGTTGSWTQIDTGRSNAGVYTFFRYTLGGTDFIVGQMVLIMHLSTITLL